MPQSRAHVFKAAAMRGKNPGRLIDDVPMLAAPRQVQNSGSKFTNFLAIGFGVTASFTWTAIATLNFPGRPGAGVDLHISVLVSLVATAIGTCLGLLIERLRR